MGGEIANKRFFFYRDWKYISMLFIMWWKYYHYIQSKKENNIITMQSIIVISLVGTISFSLYFWFIFNKIFLFQLVLVITVFTISSVNGAPSKVKRQDTGTKNSTSPAKVRPPVKHDTKPVRAKRAPVVHLPQKRSVPLLVNKPKPSKHTPSSTSKTTTVTGKKSNAKSSKL